MLDVSWLILAVVVAVLLTTWVTFTLTRLDRLHARVDAAQAAMDAQLVRRAAALQHVAETASAGGVGLSSAARAEYDAVAKAALSAGPGDDRGSGANRADAENAVGRSVAELVDERRAELRPDAVAELQEAAARVRIARRFYNDAVRDTRALRARRLPRLFRMAGRRALPEFFDIDDTLPTTMNAS